MTSGLQPYLHDAVIALHAPTQVWSRTDGDLSAPIDGVYHGDRRFLSQISVLCNGEPPSPIGHTSADVATASFDAVLRGVDDPTPDPRVRLTRRRQVSAGRMTEHLVVRSVSTRPADAMLTVRLAPDFRPLHDVKVGTGGSRPWVAEPDGDALRVRTTDGAELVLRAPGASLETAADGITLAWRLPVVPGERTELHWEMELHDPALVVTAAENTQAWVAALTEGAIVTDPQLDRRYGGRLARWVTTAAGDLGALRLALPDDPGDVFLAAGAPWFLTLFGRDSLWAARLLLPLDLPLAASTLRVLARLQGRIDDPATAQQPGKILHELRAGHLEPADGNRLPPLYYGTVDATALWVCLLVDAAAAGMPESQLRELLPALRSALDWIVAHTGDDFLRYVDASGRGLANQGWKDSDDSIQWRDGSLATGPIALCEVQGYCYEAAAGAAALLDRLGEPGGDRLLEFASGLRARFRERFWVQTPEGHYPAVALDSDGRGVDTLTSNIGHLLGTGLLDPLEEKQVAELLVADSMSSGFGLRTLSTGSAGFWPLGYHSGSVWAHDAAIAARGMARAGLLDHAAVVVSGLVDAAEAFGYRMPELFGGDARADRPVPVPYPASCRPQAWSAAAAITCLQITARQDHSHS